jgi:hypothetical protein
VTLRARTVPVASVGEADLASLWALFAATYDDVDEATFRADFRAKDHVILLDDGALRGFSTLKEVRVEVDGVPHRGTFSGDTVVHPDHWGTRVLGRAFLAHLLVRRLRHPLRPYWWVLISKGYKTYLMMANNFAEHWPRHEAPTPPATRAVMDAFGRALFADAYRADAGVVRWDTPRGRLRPGLADVTPALVRARPRVAFFEAQNPGWARGDELFCLARMDVTLPAAYAWKALRGARA